MPALSGRSGELGDECEGDGEVDADADTHHEPARGENFHVRCQSADQRCDDEEDHIGHEELVAAQPVDKIAADQGADEGTDHDGTCDDSLTDRTQLVGAGDVVEPEGNRGEIVGIDEDAA